jgi:hypothetical protein
MEQALRNMQTGRFAESLKIVTDRRKETPGREK